MVSGLANANLTNIARPAFLSAAMKVSKNQEITRVGSSGWSTGAHLDFRPKIDGKHENSADRVMASDNTRFKDSDWGG